MARKASPALLFVLLFLPPASCLPPSQRLPIIDDVGWEPVWLSPSAWRDPPLGPLSSSEEGTFPEPSSSRSCPPPGDRSQTQRAGRSAFSSKGRDGRPNSLDLTFHLLREFLEMAREERLAQKARSNKILLHNIGK